MSCTQVEWLSRTPSEIDRFLYCSWEDAKCNATEEEQKVETEVQSSEGEDKFGQAFDFKSTNQRSLDVDFWIADSGLEGGGGKWRISAVMNMISDAWMKYALNSNDYRSYLLGTQQTPKVATELNLDFASLVAVLFTTWVIQLLLPLMLVQVVYEKEQNLLIMMKMHGLRSTAYWTVNYLYFLILYVLYMFVFIVSGAVADLAIFSRNSASNTFHFVVSVWMGVHSRCADYVSFLVWQYANCLYLCHQQHLPIKQGMCGFLISLDIWIRIHRDLYAQLPYSQRCYLHVLYRANTTPCSVQVHRALYFTVENAGLFRGLYELGEYGFLATYANTAGISWSALNDDNNHMGYILLVLCFECVFFLMLSWYLEQASTNILGYLQCRI